MPPPPETVDTHLQDLLAYANRDDLPSLVQAAIVYTQFESIHPLSDGNGRIGRALIHTVLRRRGATTRVVVPLAPVLVAHRERYFDLLGGYRRGDVPALIASFADGARVAAGESSVAARRLREIPTGWGAMVGPVRAGSAAKRLLSPLPSQPILSSVGACALVDGSRSKTTTPPASQEHQPVLQILRIGLHRVRGPLDRTQIGKEPLQGLHRQTLVPEQGPHSAPSPGITNRCSLSIAPSA